MITELLEEGITINVLYFGILSDDSVNMLMWNILLAFAQFERDMIVQGTQEGKAVAKAKNPDFQEDRPPKYDCDQLDNAMKLLEENSCSKGS